MITVHGLLGAPSPQLREAAAGADRVVGGRRHLDALEVEPERRITLGALRAAVEQVRELPASAEVVVVASGDPLFFGVVRSLRAAGFRPAVVPAVSSIAAAFAAVGLPWDDAAVVSVHGRPLQPALDLARATGKVAVFTSAENGIRELAAGLAGLERWYVLAERLGEPDEQVRVLTADEAVVTEPGEPNVVLILDRPPSADDAPWPGTIAGPAPDVLFAMPVTGRRDEEPSPGPGGPKSAGQEGSDRFRTNQPVIGQVISGAASLARADLIDAVLGASTRRYTDGAKTGLPQAWGECDLIISHLALGATTRIIAPLLESKKTDPGVVVIDEAGRFVVPLVGGHAGGANALATRLAEGLDATAVLTTATDSVGIPALDTLGWPHTGDVAEVTRAILDGHPVELVRSQPWPLPPLPSNVAEAPLRHSREGRNDVREDGDPRLRGDDVGGWDQVSSGDHTGGPEDVGGDARPAARIVVSDEVGTKRRDSSAAAEDLSHGLLPTVTLRPPSLTAGMGCNRGTSAASLRELLERTLDGAGLAIESLAAIASVEAKADEAGLIALATELHVPFRTFAAGTLAGFEVPNPSPHAQQAVGTPSVAEAAVLACGADLIVPKQKTPEATCALGRLPALGKLRVVGLGPGSRDLTTPRAQDAIRNAAVVVGYQPYVDQVTDLIRPGTEVHSSGMGTEEARTALAIAKAREGRTVALVCSGDPAIYAMASPTLEQGTEGIDVEIIPGVTASLAVSAILGAPLGHDHATISLSDLHTSWENIEKRLQAAAEADLVTVLYNPRSRTRLMHLPRALEIFDAHRPPTTPVAVVEEACRPGQKVTTATLADFDPAWVNMNSLVVIGSSATCYLPTGRGATVMVTPRDYHWMKQ
ncbi:MAG: precorrin-3B C(17)-methyltransferase [Propionicimonas sp.]|uniref:precorrin-3B C(17)-methyltransferase n=1 Tax=Propionicimonas sp. TaxID=1955623 RepID=UPI002B1F725D|nr:precorrin-3B C(17)-methyltransferase [Propionicimonas sp.]MEA4943845.1 precorrin-3B C(17)-methyltransferase [Propionicimonas sp.]